MTRLIDADALKEKFENLASDDYNVPIWYQQTVFETIDNAPTVTPDMAQVLAYESGKSSDRPKNDKEVKADLCETCKQGDICELSTKILSGCCTTRCYKHEEEDMREADNDPN